MKAGRYSTRSDAVVAGLVCLEQVQRALKRDMPQLKKLLLSQDLNLKDKEARRKTRPIRSGKGPKASNARR
jgi:Arc/MetJ-type ribon-helix-helix transcriptional regulator